MSGIRVERADDILTLSFDRAAKKNAITDAMYRTLADEIVAAETDPDTLVILLRSEGDIFTAGNDLADFQAAGKGDPEREAGEKNVHRFLRALAETSKPIVAAVRGKAVGVGTTLLLHCDYVVMADSAALTTPFVGLGLVPEAASSILLPARVGHVRAFSMFALGEPVDAEQAVQWGLANRVVSMDQVDAAAREIAVRLTEQPPGAVSATKRLMRAPEQIVQRMDDERAVFNERLRTAEAQEAFAAFAERRRPDFRQFR